MVRFMEGCRTSCVFFFFAFLCDKVTREGM